MNEKLNALSITDKYSTEKYNLLTPMNTVAEIADIQKPVMNVVYISTNLDDKEIYVQDKPKNAYVDNYGNQRPATPAGYALTKKGLSKLMRAAGIKIKETKSILPSKCKRCTEVNKRIGTPVNCYSCACNDVAYSCTITVPQLTGESIDITEHKEINVPDVVKGMSEKQRDEFLKFRNEMCESKAINRALRMALHIKGTYTKQELSKPFVVAYLVPNLDHADVKKEAISHFFKASSELFGNPEQVNMIENKSEIAGLPDKTSMRLSESVQAIEDINYMPDDTPALTGAELSNNDTVEAEVYTPPQAAAVSNEIQCTSCGAKCTQSVADYSTKNFGRVLCFRCQRQS